MYKRFNKSRNVWMFLGVDLLIIVISLVFAFLLRFDFHFSGDTFQQIQRLLPILISTKMLSFLLFGLYRGMWRYTSLSDFINIVKASSLGSLLTLALVGFLYGFSGFPRSVLVIDYFLSTILLTTSRLSVRLYFSSFFRLERNVEYNYPAQGRKRLILIGAGYSAEKIIREINENRALKYNVVGMLDDDTSKVGATIHGISILGTINDLVALNIPFDETLICIPTATNVEMRRIIAICKSVNKPYRTIPPFSELIDGKVSIHSVREVSMVDLLGRKEINLDRSSIFHYLYGKRVLVTGAGGSIGSELVKQCFTFDPDLMILLDQSEHNLFKIERECTKRESSIAFQPILGDIRDKTLLYRVFASFKPHVVFHAAAYKHVPMQEAHPWEAILTNIQGTLNLVDISEEYDVDRFVLVSTDKAVNPRNIMGATKRVAEILIQSRSKNCNVKYMAVRFGNVIGSSGSVIPTFQEQIRNGGPITITDPNMKRYFMSVSEAAQLILQAGAIGKGGEIFVLDMGRPVNVKEIAYELVRLSGLEPEIDIDIQYIGMRPGEKLSEELITDDENIVDTGHEKILVLKNGVGNNWETVLTDIEKIVSSAKSYNFNVVTKALQKFIPEYAPSKYSLNSFKKYQRVK